MKKDKNLKKKIIQKTKKPASPLIAKSFKRNLITAHALFAQKRLRVDLILEIFKLHNSGQQRQQPRFGRPILFELFLEILSANASLKSKLVWSRNHKEHKHSFFCFEGRNMKIARIRVTP